MLSFSSLNTNSLVSDLPTYEAELSQEVSCGDIARFLKKNPLSPGVILIDHWNRRIVRVVSRRKFALVLKTLQEQTSKQDALQIPVQDVCSAFSEGAIRLNYDQKLRQVVPPSPLRFSLDVFHEPLVILFPGKSFRLLDMPVLLMAQSYILRLLDQEMEKQRISYNNELSGVASQSSYTEERYQHATNQVKNLQQQVSQLSQQLAEKEQSLHTLILQVGGEQTEFIESRLSILEALLCYVEDISNLIKEIVQVSRYISRDVERLGLAFSNTIDVGSKLQHMATQASVLSYRLNQADVTGFSQMTQDLVRMVDKFVETGSQVSQVTQAVMVRVNRLAEMAHQGSMDASRVLYQVVEPGLQITLPTARSRFLPRSESEHNGQDSGPLTQPLALPDSEVTSLLAGLQNLMKELQMTLKDALLLKQEIVSGQSSLTTGLVRKIRLKLDSRS